MPTTITSLANETLSEIFQSAFHSVQLDEWYQDTLPSLRLVSPHWNQVIVRSPSLWTFIYVTEQSARVNQSALFEYTQSRLLRSGTLPLHVKVRIFEKPQPGVFDKDEGNMLGKILHDVADRIASFEIHAESRALQIAILSQLSPRMPNLRSFKHTGFSNPDIGLVESFAPDFEEGTYRFWPGTILQPENEFMRGDALTEWGNSMYPVLEDVEIIGALYNFSQFPAMHILRRICIRGQPWQDRPLVSELLEMLSGARETLEELELTNVVGREDKDAQILDKPIIFERLYAFSLGYADDKVLEFLHSIRLPALDQLNLTYTSLDHNSMPEPERPGYTSQVLRAFIQHSPLAQIRAVCFNNVALTADTESTISIPYPEDELSDFERNYYKEQLGLTDFAPIHGMWDLPVFMFFLFKCTSLTYLSILNVPGDEIDVDPKDIMSICWKDGIMPALRSMRLDGSSEGLFALLSAIELDHRSGMRLLMLDLRVGQNMYSSLSKGEKEVLQRHRRVLLTPIDEL